MRMDSCNVYYALCESNNTKACECSMEYLPVPTTNQSSTWIREICTSMNMEGCNDCGPEFDQCDLLKVYSNLCAAMPTMRQCNAWNSYCQLVPDWPICSQTSHIPEMRMYFHTGIVDYVLIKQWVPTTNLQYVGTWLAVFTMGIIYELMKVIRSWLEQNWEKESSLEINNSTKDSELTPLTSSALDIRRNLRAKWRAHVDIPRSLLQTLEVCWGLLIMLVSMTYNVGLFIAILAGTFAGTLLMGRFLHYKPKASSCH